MAATTADTAHSAAEPHAVQKITVAMRAIIVVFSAAEIDEYRRAKKLIALRISMPHCTSICRTAFRFRSLTLFETSGTHQRNVRVAKHQRNDQRHLCVSIRASAALQRGPPKPTPSAAAIILGRGAGTLSDRDAHCSILSIPDRRFRRRHSRFTFLRSGAVATKLAHAKRSARWRP